MPSSHYFYADANQASGTLPKNRRRSQRLHRQTLENASNSGDAIDPDETILDETVLLSDEGESDVAGDKHPLKESDVMDLDDDLAENGGLDDEHRSNTYLSSQASSTGMPMTLRGGAEGFLSCDPLTSSTMKSTPFSAIRAKIKSNGRVNTKEHLRRIVDQIASDESDDEMDEAEFLEAIARKQALRREQLAESQQQRTQTQRTQHQSFASFRHDESLQTQRQQQSNQNESEDTARMANHDASMSSDHGRSLSESFAATQPWEKELSTSIMQNVPEKDQCRQEQQPNHLQRKQSSRNSHQHQPNRRINATKFQQDAPQKDHKHQYHPNQRRGEQSSMDPPQKDIRRQQQQNHRSLSDHQQNAPPKDSRRQHEYLTNHHRSYATSETQPNQHSLPADQHKHAQETEQYLQTSNTDNNHRDKESSYSLANPYNRKHPPGRPKNAAANVPKISLEHLKSGKKSRSEGSSTGNSCGDVGNDSIGTKEGVTWQEEAFRSSLLDILGSFPSNYFESPDNDDDVMDSLFATSATANIDDESPHSTTSQSAASAQLNRKRLFDVASRSLARLAISSRHSPKNGDGRNKSSRTSGGSSNDGESPPDFNPPSPRSLPSCMSVLNVHDDCSTGSNGDWGTGNANAMLSSSKEVFSGQSVHGRNARSVQLSIVPQGCNVPSSNPSTWSSEQLACGSMILAAQVCHEASRDSNFCHSSCDDEAEGSCRVAGFAQNLSGARGGNEKRPMVSSALVESSLGFLATSFACLESDVVYSVLKTNLKESINLPEVTVFDALSRFAPSSQDAPAEELCTIPALSLLTLSRGLDAAIFVARYSTSLDPSSASTAYSSPQLSCGVSTIDTGIDEGGVGWFSALGRDLSLRLEDNQNTRPMHRHLRDIACYAFDFILEYNPMIVDDVADSFHAGQKSGNSRRGLYVDAQGGNIRQGMQSDAFVCRQSSVMKDRIYAANAEYLSSMIHAGIVSGWLTSPVSEGGNDNEQNHTSPRTVERLCQKLFYVIETRARLRRSTNQNTAVTDPGDSEAVCAASLSLLILALPKHSSSSGPSSLSTSFRQMGNSTGSIEDLLHSPLVRKLVEMALSWQDTVYSRNNNKESEAVLSNRATNNAIYILSDICMAGGSTLVSSHFRQKLDGFLQNITEYICRGGERSNNYCFDSSCIDSSPLLFFLQLHSTSAILVRQFLRNFLEQPPASSDGCADLFVGGLLQLSANVSQSFEYLEILSIVDYRLIHHSIITSQKSFSVSSCASSLLRVLIDGNPSDRTQDRLSEIILNSFDSDRIGSSIEDVFRALVENTFTSLHCDIPHFCIRWHPRICFLGDLLSIFIPSINACQAISSSLSKEVLGVFVDAIQCDQQNDTLGGSANLSLLFLFALFANNGRITSNDENESSIIAQQRNVKEKLLRISYFLPLIEKAMAQGTSADMIHRALKLQKALLSLSDDRSLALTFAKARNAVSTKQNALHDKLTGSENEVRVMARKYQQIKSDHDSLSHSFHDQRLAYERRLELARSEASTAAKYVSEIHVYERKQAEVRYAEERELRIRTEQANELLTRESSGDKSRIRELEELLGSERKSRTDVESALENCGNELSTTSKDLERVLNDCHDLQEKLSESEDNVSDLTAKCEEAQTNLEDVCAKLIKLATIYQSKETEMDKYKSELRSAVNSANRHADTAIQKYEFAKQQNQLLSKKLEDVSSELNAVKANRADVQRMRKNAPVSYINNLRKDPSIQDKRKNKLSRQNHSGKENSIGRR